MWSRHLYLNRKLDHAVSDVGRSEGIQSLLFTVYTKSQRVKDQNDILRSDCQTSQSFYIYFNLSSAHFSLRSISGTQERLFKTASVDICTSSTHEGFDSNRSYLWMLVCMTQQFLSVAFMVKLQHKAMPPNQSTKRWLSEFGVEVQLISVPSNTCGINGNVDCETTLCERDQEKL